MKRALDSINIYIDKNKSSGFPKIQVSIITEPCFSLVQGEGKL
jgi:hypothetical protein